MVKDNKPKAPRRPPLLEWFSAGLGAVIAVGMLATLASEALTSSPSQPPSLDVQPVTLLRGAGNYVLEIEVRNRSRQTASNVTVRGELGGPGAAEVSDVTLDYVPGNSKRHAALLFTRDPRAGQLKLRATGYERP